MTTKVRGIIKKRKDLGVKDNLTPQIHTAPGVDATAVMHRLMPPVDEASCITLACIPADYSASAIARAVEDCDAHLLNLNVTGCRTDSGRMVVDLRISHRNPESAVRSLERYGFEVIATDSTATQSDSEVMRDRARELLYYLDL